MKISLWFLAIYLFINDNSALAKAQKVKNKSAKTILTCNKLKINNPLGVADMEGMVKIVTAQGFISSDKGKIFFVPKDLQNENKPTEPENKKTEQGMFKNNIKQAFFTSNVKFIHSGYNIDSDKAFYDGSYEVIMLEGNVHIKDGATRSVSSFFIYNMKLESGRLLSEADYQEIRPYYENKDVKYIYNYFYNAKPKIIVKNTELNSNDTAQKNDEDDNLEEIIKKSPNRITIYRNLSDQANKQENNDNEINR